MSDNPYDGMISVHDRIQGSMTGSQFGASIYNMPLGPARELAIQQELLAGNMPIWMSSGRPISVSWNSHYGVFWAMPDYLCVGSNDDYLRCPMNPLSAQAIADAFGASLPTRKMVNDIWKVASIQLEPHPMSHGPNMTSTGAFVAHNTAIQAQLVNKPVGALVVGHKKDVVLCKDLRPGKVAIYGWQYPNGQVIQPLNCVSHDCHYADYSHGIRLIAKSMFVDDKYYMDIDEVLSSTELYGLLSNEGPLTRTKYGP